MMTISRNWPSRRTAQIEIGAVVALVVLLPMALPPIARFQVIGAPLELSLLATDIPVAWLLLAQLARRAPFAGAHPGNPWTAALGSMFALYALVSTAWSSVPESSVERGLRIVIMILVAAVMASRGELRHAAALAWIAGAAVQAGVAVTQCMTQRSLGLTWLGEPQWQSASDSPAIIAIGGDLWARGTGLTAHPNVLGSYLAVAVVIGVHLLLSGASSHRTLILGALTLSSGGLLLSFSRGAWISACVGLVLLGAWAWRRMPNRPQAIARPMAGLAAAVVVLAVTQWPLIAARLLITTPHFGVETLPYESADLELRASSHRYASWVFSASPMLGVGLAAYRIGVFSMPMWILAELGLVGFLLALGWWCGAYLSAMRAAWGTRADAPSAATAATLVVLAVSGLFNPDGWTAESGRLSLALWIGIAGAGALPAPPWPPTWRKSRGQRVQRWMLDHGVRIGLLSVLTVWLAVGTAVVLDARLALAPRPRDICTEPNEHPFNACVIADGASVRGYIAHHYDADSYRFYAPEHGTRVRAELHDLPADYDLFVLDRRGGLIASSTQDGLSCEAIELSVNAGEYLLYVWVDPGRVHDPNSPYQLSLWFPPEHLWDADTSWNCSS